TLKTKTTQKITLKPLSRMATSTRYPDEDTPPLKRFDQQDANEAINCAAAVLVQVESWDSH
ncbi:HEPN domain-containing protein, partial [Synechococcus sp. Cruz CV12-2-Slac-r]|uniref:HEPN domain-containing protein n=1 Tax=Synechococcus sp. Cruz CV12-2-Slac-r TaxID=2823748 RepID=UPI0020CBEB86